MKDEPSQSASEAAKEITAAIAAVIEPQGGVLKQDSAVAEITSCLHRHFKETEQNAARFVKLKRLVKDGATIEKLPSRWYNITVWKGTNQGCYTSPTLAQALDLIPE